MYSDGVKYGVTQREGAMPPIVSLKIFSDLKNKINK
jgi:hypothetical protein